MSEGGRARAALLSPERKARRAAVERVAGDAPGLYALRSVLLLDPDAGLRALAARRLGSLGHRLASPWLEDAADDRSPSVRDEALRALARVGEARSAAVAKRAVEGEEIWWVRRTAVLTLAALGGLAAAPALERALGDPFWRVRKTALLALSALVGEGIDALLSRPAGAARPVDAPPELPGDGLCDPDPAVTYERLDALAPDAVKSETLVALLADPHGPLRELAGQRLAARGDAEALRAAARFLEEPRTPYAPRAARSLLSSAGQAADELAASLLRSGGPAGSLAWAASHAAARAMGDLHEPLLALLEHPQPVVRRAAVDALAVLSDDPAGALSRALGDADEGVRAGAVLSLLRDRSAPARRALASLSLGSVGPSARHALLRDAARAGDVGRLEEGLLEGHPWLRALATGALHRLGALDERVRREALSHPDPWVRGSVLDDRSAPGLLEGDPDAELRRAAMEQLLSRPRAQDASTLEGLGVAAAGSPDGWLRARACQLLDPAAGERSLRCLLSLSADAEPMVRAAAADRLEACPALSERLGRLLAGELAPRERSSAYTWLLRAGGEAELAELGRVLSSGNQPPAVRQHLRATLSVFPVEALGPELGELALRLPARPVAEAGALASGEERPGAPAPPGASRVLGSTGVAVSPLIVSGVYEPSARALGEAEGAGVNAFFWEPEHVRLTSFLRQGRARRASTVVVAGSFHASPARVERDLEQALRRLRTDRVDVFLIFWARSLERLSDDLFARLEALKGQGKVRAAGFSTHDRALAVGALERHRWDVVMTRHSAAHPGAERELFPRAIEAGASVLTFSATCYGSLLRGVGGDGRPPPSAADCYRYSLSQAAVSACLTAPRRRRELLENLAALASPGLGDERIASLRAHGAEVHRRNAELSASVRGQAGPEAARQRALALLDQAEPPPRSEVVPRGSSPARPGRSAPEQGRAAQGVRR